MKKGFNYYNQAGEEEKDQSESEQSPNQQNPPITEELLNSFAQFSPEDAYSQNLIVSLFQIVEQQARSIQTLITKVDTISAKTIELAEKLKDSKIIKKQEYHAAQIIANTDTIKQEIPKHQIKFNTDILEPEHLIKILFGSDKKFEYRLTLATKINQEKNEDKTLYRERNFSINIQLTDFQGNKVKNSNKIPLSIALYTSENPPKYIEKNTAGHSILKGYIEQSLVNGFCKFDRIQIREVSSHFRNGWIFIVVIPSMTPLGSYNPNENFIDYCQIEPLVVSKIVVKAKKIKEKTSKGNNIMKEKCNSQMDEEGEEENSERDEVYEENEK